MSEPTCESCDAVIDPIAEPHYRVTDPWGGNGEDVCENCQEQRYDRYMEKLMEET